MIEIREKKLYNEKGKNGFEKEEKCSLKLIGSLWECLKQVQKPGNFDSPSFCKVPWKIALEKTKVGNLILFRFGNESKEVSARLSMMDFRAFVNKESFKATLLQHLKHQIHAEFDQAITNGVQKIIEEDASLSTDHVVLTVATSITETDAFPNFTNTFLQELGDLFADREHYDRLQKEAHSDASSMDFLNLNQFRNVTGWLTNGINAEKLEALETFYHLPTQEHLIKQSFWPMIEAGLHSSLSSSVLFLQDASLKLYVKMLNSLEPKVVQESYSSLLKHLTQNLLPSIQLDSIDNEFKNKCRSMLEIVSVINKFLQNVSSRWLRFPQTVIEEITVSSIRLMSGENKFPIWICFSMCDMHCEWLKNIMHGYVSRSFVIRTLEENIQVLKYSIKLCEDFIVAKNVSAKACCQKSATVSEITHVVCFLSHLLQYSQSRRMLDIVMDEPSSPYWIYVLDLMMQCCRKFCEGSCFDCSSSLCNVLSKKWYYIWLSDDLELIGDQLIGILTAHSDSLTLIALSNILFDFECLCESFQSFVNSEQILPLADKIHEFILQLLNHCTGFFTACSSEISAPMYQLFCLSLTLVKKVLLSPCVLFANSNFIEALKCWWLNTVDFSRLISNPDGKKTIARFYNEVSDVHMCMLRKPISIMISHSTSLFEASLNILFEKMLKDIKSKNSVCFRDLSVIACALNCNYTSHHCLNKSIIIKLASIVWQFEPYDFENLSIVKGIIELLVPSLFSDLILIEVSRDPKLDQLFQYVLLFPNLMKCEFVCDEAYKLLALQVISILACSVQFCCILRAHFKLQDMLFDLLANNVAATGEILVDPISILSNHILIKIFTVGSACERVLPPDALETGDEYEWPFFTHLPIPEAYNSPNLQAIELVSEYDFSSENSKDIFMHVLETEQRLPPQFAFELLRGENLLVPESQLTTTSNLETLDISSECTALSDEVSVGIQLTHHYGRILNLVSDMDCETTLETFFKTARHLSGAKNDSRFDVFVATVFLMCKGNLDASSKLLESISQSTISLYVWIERSLWKDDVQVFSRARGVISEQCDLLVRKALPSVFAALQSSGLLPSSLFCEWTAQCYWNYLDFVEVSHFVLLVVLFSGDFAIYFFASILKHLSNVIISNAHDAVHILKRNSISDFRTSSYIPFIMQLARAFHDDITDAVTTILHE